MKPDAWGALARDLRWRTAALVFSVLAVVGTACSLWALHALRADSARAASQDGRALAQSVAQTLAQQFGRAVRLGIPLPELPGVRPYLEAALKRQPALTHIAVEAADGAIVHAAGREAGAGRAGAGMVRVPIAGTDAEAGTVVVGTDAGASVQRSLRRAAWQSAALVLLLSTLAALLVAAGPGAAMERQRRQVLGRLELCSLGDAPPEDGEGAGDDARRGLPALAQALQQGDEQLHAARRAVRDYAHELLAMDFDGRLRADIERCVPDIASAPPRG